MLSTSHNRAYQDFLTLLTKFGEKLARQEQESPQSEIEQNFQRLSSWFAENVAQLSSQDLSPAIASRWQAVQTEILREFKLLSTDILFLAASRQQITQLKRLKSINERLTKLISYCQIMLKDDNIKQY
ncbi:MAG: heterocyst frequency control protein PatD [Pleurocapsa sp. SU_5_0]|jgi:biotin-(acetyl-CoA carboxylase) ligase|nr:heterocyst frequency control protein PatD [Pleurocapsa sp. SU_5_0]NJO96378.1 heterocyst frequency control protein PatD [Pleurocapsa sp. CRU_1_2]NJR45475.1 heterocyst frequency control protein PatD [Hyellaceae cyanobacterium CSU_1_1]